jgi:hypothetical protein
VAAHSSLGNTWQTLRQYVAAVACYDMVLKLQPDFAEAYNNRGNALQNLNRFAEAQADYEQALRIKADYASANWNNTLLKLLTGQFEQGLPLYEWRWQKKDFATPLPSSRPRWKPGGKTTRLLIWAEQGVGDHIFFGGLLPEATQFAEQLIATVDVRLLPLFRRAMPKIAFFPSTQPLPEVLYDAHLPMGSLPAYLPDWPTRLTQTRPSYLIADTTQTRKLRRQLSARREFVIGISWRSKNPQNGEKRSLDLKAFTALSAAGVKLLNLQYGEVDAEIAECKAKTGVGILQCAEVDNMQDLDGLAALIAACDLIISADNTTAHLAGALGKPCWVLLTTAPDWRWLLERSDSPWYASVKLYRQTTAGDWEQVMAKVKTDLLPLVNPH